MRDLDFRFNLKVMSKRKAEAPLGLMIVFGVTLVIAAWIVGLLFSYYKSAKREKVYLTILWDIHVSLNDLNAIGLCKGSSKAIIKYYPLYDTYKLTCDSSLGQDLVKLNFASLRILKGCTSSDNFCEYKFAK